MSNIVLQAQGLTKRFHEGRNIDLTVLRGVDLAVQAGEAVAETGLIGQRQPFGAAEPYGPAGDT